ncbi:hypothetical protein CJ030_MR7G008284 [Morella rubra]|uniref:Uncharacterized protein n=1 Tax=Morella rubra TaxID=262757 RepID=A0A6A1UJA5_9ROSI|nr:hypothetical protein CJ030_MR0G008306 [Morella rubra]KAB1206800.1 hypothetical protein CJ030_MR7G008284 [Morella rubra]
MARDLRRFVQTFNMSRKFSDHPPTSFHGTKLPVSQEEEDTTNDRFTCDHRKRRSDWSEYLDSENEDRVKEEAEDQEIGCGCEPNMTELPEEMFKKPKLKPSFPRADVDEVDTDKQYRPVFSKRNSSTKNFISQDKEPRMCRPSRAKGSSDGNGYMTEDKEPGRKSQQPTATARGVSKWDAYITAQDDCHPEATRGRNLEDHMGPCYDDILLDLETMSNDQRAEDDVHPDFLL